MSNNNRTTSNSGSHQNNRSHQERKFQAIKAENKHLRDEMRAMRGSMSGLRGEIKNLAARSYLASLAGQNGSLLQIDMVCDTPDQAKTTWQKVTPLHHAQLEVSNDKVRIAAFKSEIYSQQGGLNEVPLPSKQGFASVYSIQKMGGAILVTGSRKLQIGNPVFLAVLETVKNDKVTEQDIRFAVVPGSTPTQSWIFQDGLLMAVVEQEGEPITASLLKLNAVPMVVAVEKHKLLANKIEAATRATKWEFLGSFPKAVSPTPSREINGMVIYQAKDKKSHLFGVRFSKTMGASISQIKSTAGQYAILASSQRNGDVIFATRQVAGQTILKLMSASHFQMGEARQHTANAN